MQWQPNYNIYMDQINMLYTLNLLSIIGQIYFNKKEKRKVGFM